MILRGGRVAESADQATRHDVDVPSRSECEIDIHGHMALPGLINAHDHLEFNLFPRLGRGPYPNSRAWAADIYAPKSDPIKQHLQVPKSTRLLWGGLKNLLSGVTTVCHHNRRDEPTLDDNFPVRVVKRFGWSHSLDFSSNVGERFKATPKSWPFILHLAEATDSHGAEEIFELDALGALDHRTVLVHGVGLDANGLALARQRGAALIWCPSSNLFTLGRTLDAAVLRSDLPVALGSDSALTADGDLLDELRVANRTVDCAELYRMITTAARDILRLPVGYGTLGARNPGDIAVFRDVDVDPATTLLQAGPPEMVVVGGRIALVSDAFAGRLSTSLVRRLFQFSVCGRKVFSRLDVADLLRKTVPILGSGFRLAGKKITA